MKIRRYQQEFEMNYPHYLNAIGLDRQAELLRQAEQDRLARQARGNTRSNRPRLFRR